MNLSGITSKLTEDRIYGKAVAGMLAVILSTTGVAAMKEKTSSEIDCPCNGTCTCHYETELAAEIPAEGVGRVASYSLVRNLGCPDWNLNTSIYGWDGRMMEVWELDLFSRIFYLEFWGSGEVLCEAGCDAILRLWETEEFGKTLGDLLTARNAAGSRVYEVYDYVWDWTYDQEGLAWCKDYCLERFQQGPTWVATYFQKYGYPDWGEWTPTPCYEIDGIYFSIASH